MRHLAWFVARRYLASRRKGRFLSAITLIAVGGIAVGVMALMVVIAVMTGLQRDLQAKILGTTPHIYVFQQNMGFRLGGWERVLEQVRQVPGVTAAEPFMQTNVAVTLQETGGAYAEAGVLYGIDPHASRQPLTDIERQIRAGELSLAPSAAGLPGLLMGARLAEKLGVFTGDTVVVATLENIHQTPTGFMPALRQFAVTGTFRTGMYEYDLSHMYGELAEVQSFLDLPPDTVSGIAVNISDPWRAEQVANQVRQAIDFPYYTWSWMALNGSLFSALKLEKLAMAVILSLIVLVAAFNIVSTLIMVVRDKTREIGILKSMGMTDETVLRIFVLQGVAVGVIGTALGTAGGLLLIALQNRYQLVKLSGEVYFIEQLPAVLDWVDAALIVGISLLIAFGATIYPARQAARLVPVDAIRHE
ncbi:MAG TPA: FtsX-like permease family protein [Longimicrobiales bacterium]|nr:FtsX-like permease family protein [Longimicrobiales bacterium]